jgi:hypothetical protein
MEKEKSLTLVEQQPGMWLSPSEMKLRVQLIQQIMKDLMTEGEHYGEAGDALPAYPAL